MAQGILAMVTGFRLRLLLVVLFVSLMKAGRVGSAPKTGGLVRTVTLDSGVRDLQWVGESDMVVLAVTNLGRLWRSKDGGLTWVDMSDQLPGLVDDPPLQGSYAPSPGAAVILFHPKAQNKVLLRGFADVHWVTEDYGETFSRVQGPAGYLGDVTLRMHPTETDWILAIARRWACWSAKIEERKECADDLFVTQDFGRTWTNLTDASQGRILSFVDFDWGWSKDPSQALRHPQSYSKETVLASAYEATPEVVGHLQQSGGLGNMHSGWDRFVSFVRSGDMFRTAHETVMPCGNQFEIQHDELYLAVAASCGSGTASEDSKRGVKLFMSLDYGGSFSQACFPETLSERGFSFLDVSDSGAYVNVDHWRGATGASQLMGTTYSSDANLTLFALTLKRTARGPYGTVDFTSIKGLPGIFVANQVASDGSEGLPGGGHSFPHGPRPNYAPGATTRLVTRISFNGGSQWQPIPPPEKNLDGVKKSCADTGCSLHLHGPTSWAGQAGLPGFAFVYSQKSAPGVVLATGNVGQYLYQDGVVDTYLSQDGGHTWIQAGRGAYIYEFGDFGGIIVMAKHYLQGTTNEIRYSLDEGLSWDSERFSDDPIDVYNIRVEPDNAGRRFIVQGLTRNTREGILIPVDFSADSTFKMCGPDDYEDWQPAKDHCLLGTNITVTRHKREARCWNGENWERRPTHSTLCPCTDSNYECDFGSEWDAARGRCVRMADSAVFASCPVVRNGQYGFSPTHLRKVAGDQCVAGSEAVDTGSYTMEASIDREEEGGVPTWATVLIVAGVALVLVVGVLGLMVQQGRVPDWMLDRMPWFGRVRYANIKSQFQSLADDFGMELEDEGMEDGAP